MLLKLSWADLAKNKIIMFILAFFIMLASFLIASSTNMIVELARSLNYLLIKSNAPHYVQMNEGSVDNEAITHWSSLNKRIKDIQVVKMLLINNSKIYLGSSHDSENNSVMNLYFVTQNYSFDFLINLHGEVINLNKGEIAVPLYFMQRNNLKIGDKVKIVDKNFSKEFIISDFIRDIQMNPSIIHSKRFLVNKDDFNEMQSNEEKLVWLIEFQLHALTDINNFATEYQLSGLPKNGPSIDYHLYKILNSVTDGIIIGIIILVSMLFIVVSILCLRFTILTTLEEDYKQIGIMKALGIAQSIIRKIYLIKYALIAGTACGLGYILSIPLKKIFISNILLYLGVDPRASSQRLIPFISVCFIFLIIIFVCRLLIKKFDNISAVEALRESVIEKPSAAMNFLSIWRNNIVNVNIFIGIKDILQRFKMFFLLFIVFIICSFIIILPINFLNTIKSPHFITYMGVGKSDIRIDLRHTTDLNNQFKKIVSFLENDKDVKNYSPMSTAKFKVFNKDGSLENINVETGDFSIFPIKYLQGRSPINSNEISLSYLQGQQLKKNVGDFLNLIINNQIKKLIVSGIYQDITNGGKTAKAYLSFDPDFALWYVINVEFKSNILIDNKAREYANIFYPVRVTHLTDYLQQTLGDLIKQVEYLTYLILLIALFITLLITSLFLKMLITKHYSQIAIMKAIGFSLNNIRLQYLTRSLFVLNLGIIIGVITSGTIGQQIVSFIWSFMGAPEIKLIINPIEVYFYYPLLLIFIVTIITLLSTQSIKQINIRKLTSE